MSMGQNPRVGVAKWRRYSCLGQVNFYSSSPSSCLYSISSSDSVMGKFYWPKGAFEALSLRTLMSNKVLTLPLLCCNKCLRVTRVVQQSTWKSGG